MVLLVNAIRREVNKTSKNANRTSAKNSSASKAARAESHLIVVDQNPEIRHLLTASLRLIAF